MLAVRIIPCLDVAGGRVVKGVNFLGLRDAGDPVEVARRYENEGADELVFLDIHASHEGRGILEEMVARVAEECHMPFTVGGGIKCLDDAKRLIQAGAEKVSINSAAVKNPELVAEISRRFGSCATVVNIDPKRVQRNGRETWVVHIHGGRLATEWEAVSWAREVERLGAGEIILTSMDADGTKNGYDIPVTKAVAEAVGIPVVASGGAGSAAHMLEAVREAHASAVLAAGIFHYREVGIGEVKAYLRSHGIPVRPEAGASRPKQNH